MRLYLHTGGKAVQVIENVDASTRLRDVIPDVDSDLVFLDEDDEPVSVDVVLLGVLHDPHAHHHHVHLHRCRRIAVRVNYNGTAKTLEVAPSSKIKALLKRVVLAFGIDPITGATLVLRIPGADADLSASAHLSDLVSRNECRLQLNLLPSLREAG